MKVSQDAAASSIRTLFVMLDCEFPPKTGTPQGVWRNLTALAKLGPLAVFSVRDNLTADATLPGVERWQHVANQAPHGVDRRPFLRRVFERLIRLFVAPQYPYFHLALERQANRELRKLIAEFRPTVAVVDHWLNAVIPRPLRRGPFPVIVASHDVEWQLGRDLTAGPAPLLKRLRAKAEIWYVRRLEGRLYREADQTWAVSERDRQAIQRFTGLTSQVRTLPAVMEIERYADVRGQALNPARTRARSGPTLLYAGGYMWSPNVDAAHVLIADVYPRLRAAYPGTRLVLVGPQPTEHMLTAARRDDGIVVTGEVPDVRPYLLEADIVPVTLRIGGGMRVKILESFAAGVPVVSTTKGAEGIDVADGRELLVRDDVPEFVGAIQTLWEDPAGARAMAERAFDFVRRDHSMDLLIARVRAEVHELMAARGQEA